MDFFKQHSWIVFGGLFLLFLFLILSFGLGAAVGVSSSRDDFLNIIIPLLSMVGTWFSGAGALAAALVSLWLAGKHREEDIEDCDIEYSWKYGRFRVQVVSIGKRQITIMDAGIQIPGSYCSFEIDHKASRPSLPATLSYGQAVDIAFFYGDTLNKLSSFFEEKEITGESQIQLYVESTTGLYSTYIDSSSLAALVKEVSEYSVSQVQKK